MPSMRDLLFWLESSISLSEEAAVQSYIDPKMIDMYDEYHRLNKKLYDGKLGTYPMKWNRTKGAGALVKGQKVGKEMKVTSIEVSTFYAQTLQGFRDRLAHEMIHVYFYEKNMDVNHTRPFVQEMNRINRMNAGVTVTLREDTRTDNIGGYIGKGKKMGVLVQPDNKGIMVVTEKDLPQIIYNISVGGASMKRIGFDVFTSELPFLQELRHSRASAKSFSWNNSKVEQGMEVRASGKWMGRITMDGWEPSQDGKSLKLERPEAKKVEKALVIGMSGHYYGRAAVVSPKHAATIGEMLDSLAASFKVYTYGATWMDKLRMTKMTGGRVRVKWNTLSPNLIREIEQGGKLVGTVDSYTGWSKA